MTSPISLPSPLPTVDHDTLDAYSASCSVALSHLGRVERAMEAGFDLDDEEIVSIVRDVFLCFGCSVAVDAVDACNTRADMMLITHDHVQAALALI